MNRSAVIGARGMLGYAVTEYLSRRGDTVVAVSRSEFDIARDPLDRLEGLLEPCTRVVNCAGVIKPRIADTPVEDVLKVNAIFPRNLARLCARRGLPLYHVTTDCVYSGEQGGYTEESYFDAGDLYGLSKNAGDAADCMVLRTSIIGEERGQSRSLVEWARSQAGKQVQGFTNHRWNGVTTVYLAEIVETIDSQGLYERGIFHVHSPDTVTKDELVRLLGEIYELSLDVRPVEAPTACDRSLGSVKPLSGRVVTKRLAQQIREMRAFFRA